MVIARRRVLVLDAVEEARLKDVHKFLDKYLCWQNVEGEWDMDTWKIHWRKKYAFEGELTQPQFKEVLVGLQKRMDLEKDGALLLYRRLGPAKRMVLEVARVRSEDNQVLASHKIDAGKRPAALWIQGVGAWKDKDTLYKVFTYLTWRCAMLSLGLG